MSQSQMKHKNRVLTADDVKKSSRVCVQVQTGDFNQSVSTCAFFEINRENLIERLKKSQNINRYSNWCFSLDKDAKDTCYYQNDFLEIPDDYLGEIEIIIGQMER